jgi:hypothetical protein
MVLNLDRRRILRGHSGTYEYINEALLLANY